MKKNIHKGTSLLLTLLVMAAFLAIALGVSRLSFGEITMFRDQSKSIVAYYAAESGVECQMFNDRTAADPNNPALCPSACLDIFGGNQVCYSVNASGNTPNRTITSVATYRDVNRAVELTY
jgi:hypothetical protein